MRRDGDSNPGNPFGVYTLSRRASSTTRASLLLPVFGPFFGPSEGTNPKSGVKLQKIIDMAITFGKKSDFFCHFRQKSAFAVPFVAFITSFLSI